MGADAITIRQLTHVTEADLAGLIGILMDCVAGGASVSFMAPLTHERAQAFWRGVADSMAAGERIVLLAEDAVGPVGTVQVILAAPENQPHRGDIAKMLVHRRARGQGLGATLLATAETAAATAGKTLLVLDTVPNTAGDRLYRRSGWTAVGTIPGYALWPDGRTCDTTIFYKQIG